jgi:hypothetical protein
MANRYVRTKDEGDAMIGRCMYIWKLKTVLNAEGGVNKLVDRARAASIQGIWVKIADGSQPYANVTGAMEQTMSDFVTRAHSRNIQVWGWQVPHCPSTEQAKSEVSVFEELMKKFSLDGAIMDAEGGAAFFQGDADQAQEYADGMRTMTRSLAKPLGISSNDIPQNIEGWLPKFNILAKEADYNFPQTYYGASPSVQNRVDRAEKANVHLAIPFVPVGAGFLGLEEGGCASASACGERARSFIQLCEDRGYKGYSFWHWGGAPLELWNVLND